MMECQTLCSSQTAVVREYWRLIVSSSSGRLAVPALSCCSDFVLKVNPNGKIPVVNEQTNVEHIYAIGDCTSVDVVFHDAHWANPELTPVAVQVQRVGK